MNIDWLRRPLLDVLGVLVPRVCEVCGSHLVNGETHVCVRCMSALPRTNLHLTTFGELHQRLMCHYPIERAAAYFYYVRGDAYSGMIRTAKYNNRPALARHLGRCYATELNASGFLNEIDLIMPVPMHWVKQLRRGYNQAEEVAIGIAEATDIAIADHLYAARHHSSQTRKGRYERWLNSKNLYYVDDPDDLKGLHILLVDDVITTGATMVRCIEMLGAACQCRISVAALAMARSR